MTREETIDLAKTVIEELRKIADIIDEVVDNLDREAQKKGRGLTRPFLLLLVVIPAIQQEGVSP